ncbi:TetR/AcrR family transcriptional regulator [Gordonia lacunae]|uniref:TetR family transcriptional regulator n=1 Tax=Gordonia lacunae TaxID=417102 RepID=A0A243Q8R2_9ACTN|nr:TetR family transcriptional regulator [Gordonia lacunae]OUC78084.1 TetR family transcriptional regulator [Gordonia lacunae]
MAVRDQLITTTAGLMRRKGVAATSIADILEDSGVARRSIYLNFPGGKSELVTATTMAMGEAITAAISGVMERDDPIVAFANMWSSMLAESDFDGGCPVLAAALGQHTAPEATAVAVGIFGKWREVIAQRLISDHIDPHTAGTLAATIVMTIEGAVVMSIASKSATPLYEAATHLNELVALHRPPDRSR